MAKGATLDVEMAAAGCAVVGCGAATVVEAMVEAREGILAWAMGDVTVMGGVTAMAPWVAVCMAVVLVLVPRAAPSAAAMAAPGMPKPAGSDACRFLPRSDLGSNGSMHPS